MATDVLVASFMLGNVGVGQMVHGAVLGNIAESSGVGVVKKRIRVFRDSVNDLVTEVEVTETEVDQLSEIAGTAPRVEAAFVDDLFPDKADTDGKDIHGELIGEAGGTGFAEGFAQSVVTVGPRRGLVIDVLTALIAADGVVAAGIDDLFDAGVLGSLKDVVRSDDVGAKDFVIREVRADFAGEVDDTVDSRSEGANEFGFGDVSLIKGFVWSEIDDLGDVSEQQLGIAPSQQRA